LYYIAEAFLHNYLLEVGVKKSLLEGKTLGGLIAYAEIYLMNKGAERFPLNHYKDIQQLRNSAVHPALATGKKENQGYDLSNLDCFDHIIRYFGI